MDKNEILCLDCNQYFENINSFNQVHDSILNKVLKNNHSYIEAKNTLEYISKMSNSINILNEKLQKKDKIINELSKRIELIEDLNKDFFLECNILVRNGKNILNNIGTCFLNFISRCINFRIECKGDIINNDKNKFNIEIIFPFRKAEIKQCFIEKIIGCVSSQEITDSDANSFIIFNSYSSYVEQKNSTTSIKLLKNYSSQGKFEQKKINVIINGTLIFRSLFSYYDKPIILYNINKKKFLCYEDFNWKFVDNFNLDDGTINEGCLISLLIDDKDKDIEYYNNHKVYIKGKHKYLGYMSNYVASDKKDAQLRIIFHNKLYGLVEILYDNNSLTSDENGKICFNNNEKIFYLICNIENYNN